MKKVFIFILFLISLYSCTIMDYSDVWDFEITDSMRNEIHDIKDIETWVVRNIKYESDDDRYGKDVFQTCKETLTKMKGNCTDMSILILGIAYKMYGTKGYLRFYMNYSTGIGHTYCTIKGKDYYNGDGIQANYRTLHFDEIHLNMLR